MGYVAFSQMSHADFQHFISPANDIGQVLQSHFFALQLVMGSVTTSPYGGIDRWLNTINNISIPMRKYIEWPISVQAEVEAIRNIRDTVKALV